MPFLNFSWLVSAGGAGNSRPTGFRAIASLGCQDFVGCFPWFQLFT